jgi:hypothetical protein
LNLSINNLNSFVNVSTSLEKDLNDFDVIEMNSFHKGGVTILFQRIVASVLLALW